MYQHNTYYLAENDNYHPCRTAFEIWFRFVSLPTVTHEKELNNSCISILHIS